MRTRTIKLLFLSVASVALITSCNHSSGGFDTDSKTGVIYRFIGKHDDNGQKPADTDFVKIVLAFSKIGANGKDSTMFDSRKRGDSTGAIMLNLKKTYHACLEDGLMLMSPGDSAEFQINADSLYLKYFHYPPNKIPAGITGTTVFTFHIKMKAIVTKKDMMEEQNKQRQKMMEEMMARKSQEAPMIAAYLTKNNYTSVKPESDSIFVLEDKKGKGKEVKEGDSLEVSYIGMTLDGNVFDRSDKGPGHTTWGVLYSKDQSKARVIQGWINVLGKMHEGDSVKVLIPSALGYGPRGNGPTIPPFSPLVFGIKVVKVKANKEATAMKKPVKVKSAQ
jgi:FKBP-type peptidyl-prolyl cis-trans isomerase FkpA